MTLNDILKSYSDFTDRFWETACFNEKEMYQKMHFWQYGQKLRHVEGCYIRLWNSMV